MMDLLKFSRPGPPKGSYRREIPLFQENPGWFIARETHFSPQVGEILYFDQTRVYELLGLIQFDPDTCLKGWFSHHHEKQEMKRYASNVFRNIYRSNE